MVVESITHGKVEGKNDSNSQGSYARCYQGLNLN